jgi:pimeloyl-ACP methyl ester carboxylesterase
VRPVEEGASSRGLPWLRLGEGPPLLVAAGLTPEHKNPTGMWRRMSVGWATPFADHFTVYLVNRRPGLAPGTTMADLAADYAAMIEDDLGGPAFVHGTSTGGSVSLQLAVDRPELVRRLVLSAAACRVGPYGLQVQADVARLIEAGEQGQASGVMFESLAPKPLAPAARGLGRIVGRSMAGKDLSDMVATIAAEDAFDAEPDLARVQAPTLVLGGTGDRFYTEDLFRRTAAGVPDGRVVLFPGKSHGHVAGSKVAAGVALGFLLAGPPVG